MKSFSIGNRKVGDDHPAFIIAEAGVNHNGEMALAKKLVETAANAGADCVKFQTFEPELVASSQAPKAEYQQEQTDPNESQLDMIKKLYLPQESFLELKDYALDLNLIFMSTAFDFKSIEFLSGIIPAFKVPSGEITNDWFLEAMAKKQKPMIISTGMSSLGEVEHAIAVVRNHGASDLAVLHCTSNYPALPKTVNLRAMNSMGQAFNLPFGLSDHTEGIDIAVAAVARGAKIIEKHFTLDKSLPGPDHTASLSIEELNQLIRSIRNVEEALGDGIKQIQESEKEVRDVARRSLVALEDLQKDTILGRDNLIPKRPGTGIPIKMFEYVKGRKLRHDVQKDKLITWEDLY
ncbi:MAG: N,N'-diacetyllegionaminic acid synthase [Candidatus Heimdallarchaeota archaeon LC_2]|nr:MAG: N,N'-diacetyllegionaminic acid synthase [Candidatus Heimdallarchaeota archaeon LC_2]